MVYTRPWDVCEDECLRVAVGLHGRSWEDVSGGVPGRSAERVILSLGRAKSAQERNSSIFKRETFYRREIAIYGNLSSQIIVEVTVT